MSTTRANVKDAFHAWVVALSGLTADRVVWADEGEGGPRPATYGILLRVLTWPRVGGNIDGFFPSFLETEFFPMIGTYEPTLSIEGYGVQGVAAVATLQGKIYHQENDDIFNKQRVVNILVKDFYPSTKYEFTFDGIAFSFTTGATGTVTTVRNGFIALINVLAPYLYSGASVNGAGGLQIKGSNGVDFDVAVAAPYAALLGVTEVQAALSIAVLDELNSGAIPVEMETGYEAREVLDLRMGTSLRSIDRPGVIEHAEVTSTINGRVEVSTLPA